MATVDQINQWRKTPLEIHVTYPAPRDELRAALRLRGPVMTSAIRFYRNLLTLYELGFRITKLDTNLDEIGELNLYRSQELYGTTGLIHQYTFNFGWQTTHKLWRMRMLANSTSDDELFSKAVFALWDAHLHVEQDGYVEIAWSGVETQLVSAEDFYEFEPIPM